MKETLHLQLDPGYLLEDGGHIDEEIIERIIHDNDFEFYELMARTCAKYDMRAQLDEESLQVEAISLEGKRGVAHVVYDWGAYYGCKDMNSADTVTDDWPFSIEGSRIAFDLPLPPIDRGDEI